MSQAGAAERGFTQRDFTQRDFTQRGFTLVELLVALTIVALMAAVALPNLSSLLRPDIDRTTRRVALAIRDHRTAAMRSGRLVNLTAEQLTSLLPAGTAIASDELGETGLVFLPTGGSTGGRIVLAASDGRRAVNIDWLTGRVSVGRAP